MIVSQPIAKESGHWYNAATGEPCYTVKGSNGKERATTLRDARTMNLVPSVTTVTKIMDKPGLANWIADQIVMSALTLPRNNDETDKDYISRIKLDSNERRNKAAARGTALHTDIEMAIQGKPHGHTEHIAALASTLLVHGIDLFSGEPERSFAHPDGFGGKIDYSERMSQTILDFKSKDTIEEGKRLAYDEHAIQLGAYGYGLGFINPRCLNVFIGIDDENISIIEHTPEEIERGYHMFDLLLQLWKVKNKIL